MIRQLSLDYSKKGGLQWRFADKIQLYPALIRCLVINIWRSYSR